MNSINPDLVVPAISKGEPRPGVRIVQSHPDYRTASVHHMIYLPSNWEADRQYPLLVEFTGNQWRSKNGDQCSGRVEDAVLGYGISGGRDFIWVVLPFVDEKSESNVSTWWGDAPDFLPTSTVAYAKKTIPWVCEKFGGDSDKVVLCGFSRGSIACNYIGLHDDEIAKLWTAFVCYSHYDGAKTQWPYPNADRKSAAMRLSRLSRRPQFIIRESGSTPLTMEYLKTAAPNGKFTFAETGFTNHSDKWILRPSPSRAALRNWITQILN